jgi:hypothetical protein
MVAMLGLDLGIPDGRIRVTGTDPVTEVCGFRVGDAIEAINDQTVNLGNAQRLFSEIAELDAGVPFTMGVDRDGVERTVTCSKELSEYIARHVFAVDPAPTDRQLALRSAWTKNLD